MNAFVTKRSVIVDDAADKFAIYAFVVVELVSVASVSVEDAAVKSLIATFPAKRVLSLKSEVPLNTALRSVGVMRERLFAVPRLIVGESIVVSFR